jgi:uncharacterized membrane protein
VDVELQKEIKAMEKRLEAKVSARETLEGFAPSLSPKQMLGYKSCFLSKKIGVLKILLRAVVTQVVVVMKRQDEGKPNP